MPGANNVLQVVINGVNRAGPAFTSVAGGAAAMGAAVAAAFIKATAAAAAFENKMAEVRTLTNATAAESRVLTNAVRDLAVQFGQVDTVMATASYNVVSAGFGEITKQTKILEVAAKAAIAGVTDVNTSAKVITQTLNAYGKSAREAEAISDMLFATVKGGMTTFAELAQYLGQVTSTAAAADIPFEEVAAALAVMTKNSVDTAKATTALNGLILAIGAAAGESKDKLADLGITLNNGLGPALAALSRAGNGNLQVLRELIPSVEALRAATSAGANGAAAFNEQLQNTRNSAGSTAAAYAIMERQGKQAEDRFKSAAKALHTTIGEAGLEARADFFNKMADALGVMAKAWTDNKGDFEDLIAFLSRVVNILPTAIRGWGIIGQHIAALDARLSGTSGGTLAERLNTGSRPQAPGQTSAELRAGVGLGPRGSTDVPTGPVEPDYRSEAERRARERRAQQRDLQARNAQGRATDLPVPEPEAASRDDLADAFEFPVEYVKVVEEQSEAYKRAQAEQARYLEGMAALKQQIASLAEFTFEDFSNMAFAIGDTFGQMAGDVGNHLLGLTQGPLMLGRAFKQMAAGIISDIARIIARLLVARALMAAFGGGGIFGGIAKGLGLANGGFAPRAAFGYSVPGGMPPMILPGTPGMDRTPVWARGGELFVPRERVNAAESMMKRALSGPRAGRTSRSQRAKIQFVAQVNRPFRTSEQLELRDSVVEGLNRSGRHRG